MCHCVLSTIARYVFLANNVFGSQGRHTILILDIQFHQPILNDLARELKQMCPMNVFDIEELPVNQSSSSSKKSVSANKDVHAVVARPRDCTMCRECIRTNGWENNDRVNLMRAANHYIFTVETTGCLPPEVLVKQV